MFSQLARETLGALTLLLLLLFAFALGAALRRLRLEAELTRKATHLAASIAVMPLPYLVRNAATIPILFLVISMALYALRKTGRLSFLDDVERSRITEYAYALGVGTTFLFSRGDRSLFLPAVGILGLSDAVAAVVGTRLGRHRFSVLGCTRSIEGSAAFALSAAVVILTFQASFGARIDAHMAGVAVAVGAGVALVEALSVGGIDNFTIPTASVLLLALSRQPFAHGGVATALATAHLLLPVVVAGLLHQVIRRRWPKFLSLSLDRIFFRGRTVFGANKTVRGFVLLPLFAGLVFLCDRALAGALFPGDFRPPLDGLPTWTGFGLGLAYASFELPNSFLKRRLGISPGAQATRARHFFVVLDHVDGALGCALLLFVLGVQVDVLALAFIATPLVHLIVNAASHRAGLRNARY